MKGAVPALPPSPFVHPEDVKTLLSAVVWRGMLDLSGEEARLQMTYVTLGIRELTGYDPAECLATENFWRHIAAPESKPALEAHLASLSRDQAVVITPFRVVTKRGDTIPLELRTQRLRELSPDCFEILGSVTYFAQPLIEQRAPTERELLLSGPEATIRHLAFHDTLTGLPNRLLLQERLLAAFERAHHTGQETAVIFLDLDGFKTINDTLGHQAGDQLLTQVAQRLRSCVRGNDLVARFGGDEFVVVLPQAAGSDAQQVAGKILNSLRESFNLEGREVYVNASIGIAIAPRDGDEPDSLLKNADNALYQAKEAGRNTIRHFTPTMHLMSSARLLLEEGLRKAIELNEFYLEYQPILDLRSNQIVAAEVLIRWHHPLRGNVLPSEFIPLAEEVGIINSMGKWILAAVLKQIKAWRKQGITPPLLSINISAAEFKHDPFGEHLSGTVKKARVSPEHIQLELTENVAVDNPTQAAVQLQKLRQAGFSLALDDFGKGVSSLTQLKMLPFCTLKVDESFVREISTNKGDQAILQAIVTLGHTLGMKVCAEGVETAYQEELVRRFGCDLAQGYFISRPIGADELTERFLAPRKHRAKLPR